MFSYHDFEDVFSFDTGCVYNPKLCRAIEANRKSLLGLFIDQIMKRIGIRGLATKLFPPKSNGDLRKLHQAVIDSAGQDQDKISVLYYILLHIDATTGKREHSTKFAGSSFLPETYQITAKGLWHMDQKEFDIAVQYLTHPSLTPAFPDEVLENLVRYSQDLSLGLAYYHSVQPVLKQRSAIECFFSAAARTSVTEAFYFSRAQPEHTQRHMFEMLIAVVLNNSSKDPKETAAGRSVELVNLPFSVEENLWFEDYLCHGEGTELPKSRDTVMFRRIATGQLTESLKTELGSNRAIGGLGWKNIANAVGNGLGPRLEE
ncbi:nuclear pore complex assembly-domain-containing protein [Amylocarpus encephaloides]|uniref:Nuclear pore complex assembly-domain-containing protein n=1 Tax=Amylocarpus encephaloides TaxID=45428 RepID=A0A9P7YCN2_9HELO|nr:nuclear pore complex assembly-domain-containing protein [Amylocarpus encephaloides]